MLCKEVEAVVEQEGLAPLPKEGNAHLAECHERRNYIADLTSIVDVARKMPSEIEPPERIWISLRTQLEREGIIREALLAPSPERISWWHGFTQFSRSRALPTATPGMKNLFPGSIQVCNDTFSSTSISSPIQNAPNAPDPI